MLPEDPLSKGPELFDRNQDARTCQYGLKSESGFPNSAIRSTTENGGKEPRTVTWTQGVERAKRNVGITTEISDSKVRELR